MKCSICSDLMDDYIRGFVPQHVAEKITEHLSLCDQCASDYESFKNFLTLMESEPELVIEKDELIDFVPGVWEKIESERKAPLAGWLYKLVPSLLTALVLSLVILKPPIQYIPEKVEYSIEEDYYNEESYNTLLGIIFPDEESDLLDLIENELYSDNIMLFDENYSVYLNEISNEELELIEIKLESMIKNTG